MSLTRKQLIHLGNTLRDRWALSVYIDASAVDPAARLAWRTALRNAVDAARLTAPRTTLKQFDRSIEHLDEWLDTSGPGPTSACVFVAEDGIAFTGELSRIGETSVHWQTGAWILPCAVALTTQSPVLVVLIDSRSAAVHAYVDGELESRAALRVTPHSDDVSHMGEPATQGFHGGTRGTTRHDAAQRARLSASRRLLAEATHVVSEAANGFASIVIGGSRDLPMKLRDHLPLRIRHRTIVLPELRRRSPRTMIIAAAEHGAAVLRAERDRRQLQTVLERSGAHTSAVVGPVATLDAVQRGSAESILLTPQFLVEHPAEAERVLEGALAEGGEIRLLEGAASAELDERGGGIGAALRFTPAYAHAGETG